MNRFCPKCGKNDDGKFVKGFCRACYMKDHTLASYTVYEKCPNCPYHPNPDI